ncbi:tetracycline regulation of excision, RteC [Ornithobacterium rhinotracheale]|uniref:RteC domain-containing protein n=1 Tax=Ornithobacterium rhinotracheale TaxID=28251 RepID=UPI00129C2FE4|nr:RteC domain-containing protein [Ornithobacterium rhinotracheale]MRJ09131.1 tetracycline regulation of excision, RteC [Ornithobacterium rhinotracheale]UOH78914.1 RteC domain-containing protein [Ornithobacterium rhinotracheale]
MSHYVNMFRRIEQEIEKEEKKVTFETKQITQEALKIVIYLNDKLQEFRKEVLQKGFEDDDEEIYFFRHIKPNIQGKLIFYNRVYRTEMLRPTSINDFTKKYFSDEEERCRKRYDYFLKSDDFYRYYWSGRNDKDALYFKRFAINLADGLENHVFDLDPYFSTYYDYLVARIIARELFYDYLLFRTTEKQYEDIEDFEHSLEWSASKNALVELIYALYCSGAISNGNTNLSAISFAFQRIFKVELKDINHSFHRMKFRSKSQTLFIDQLQSSLQNYINKNL